MSQSDEDAWKLTREIARKNAEQRARRVADAKAAAGARGKEPFDLAKLETMCDTTREGKLDPEDVRRERFEQIYYVQFPDLMTLAELARKIDELARW